MKIAFIISSLKAYGGTERVVTLLANKLSVDYDIQIINRDTEKKNSAFQIDDNVHVKVIHGSIIQFYYKLNKYLKHQAFDLIIVHNMGKLSLLVGLLPELTPKWTYEHSPQSSRPFWLRSLSRFIYRKYKKIITVTESDALTYSAYPEKVIRLKNPMPYERWNTYNNVSKKIIAIGRLTPSKGFDKLIQAWSLICEKYPDWSLNLYGDGEKKSFLQKLIVSKNIKNAFIHSARSNIDIVYKEASFLVMSSKYEGLGMVLVEAQAFSLPTISFDCPFGPREIIHHQQTGLLVENQNIRLLAEAIEALISNSDQRLRFSKNAFESSRRFSLQEILLEWKTLFEKHFS